MGTTSRNGAGFIAAALLLGLTLSVFWRNQYSGPEGALHRFLDAVKRGDAEDALEAVQGERAYAGWVGGFAARAFRAGGDYVVANVNKHGEGASALVVFYLPGGTRIQQLWWLTKTGRDWRVDLNMMMSPMGMKAGATA
jgi:hypothetical protein